MRADRLLALALSAALLTLPTASAHTPGAPPVATSGNLLLQPSGEANSTIHILLTNFSLPISARDTLLANWSANGGAGPKIYFEIHSHGGLSAFKIYFNTTALFVNTTWVVPDTTENLTYWVLFENPTIAPVNITYRFVLSAPPPDFGPLFFLFPAVAGVAFGWFLYIRAGKPGAREEDLDGSGAANDASGEAKGDAPRAKG
jgi:hypothetical protein